MITVEIDRIRIEGEGSEVIYLTHEGARDLQRQLDDILGPVESEFVKCEQPELGPFTFTIPDIPIPTITWGNSTSPPFNFASPWDFM